MAHPFEGVLKTLRFNAPWYLGGAVGLGVGVYVLGLPLPGAVRVVGQMAWGLGAFWWVASLVGSHWIYDRSGIARGAWLEGIDPAAIRTVAVLHAGQDEASAHVRRRLPDAQVAVFDFFDAEVNQESSLLRARLESAGAAVAPWRDAHGPYDLICLVFAAHEVREPHRLAAFLRDVGGRLAPEGQLLLVEHFRDLANTVIYGPGVRHFLPPALWRRAMAEAGLKVRALRTISPFIHVVTLERVP